MQNNIHTRVIITGATSGLGHALTKLLSQNSNHHIIALGRNNEKLDELSRNHSNVTCYSCDFDRLEEIKTTANHIINDSSSQHQLHFIHCAGTAKPTPILDLNRDNLINTFQANLLGPFELLKRLIPHMKNSRILLVSTGIINYAMADLGIYSMSKASLQCLQKSLNIELSPLNTIAGTVVPGIFESPMQQRIRNNRNCASAKIFQQWEADNALREPSETAKYIRNVLFSTNDHDFASVLWDIDSKEDYKLFS